MVLKELWLCYHRVMGVEGELPRFEADVEDQPCEEDDAATNRAKTAFDSWMKLVEEQGQDFDFCGSHHLKSYRPCLGRFGKDIRKNQEPGTSSSTAACR